MSIEIINQVSKTFFEPIEKRRTSCRGVVIKDGKVLLSHELKKDVYMSPGGGLEEGESLAECCKREILEETGVIASVDEQVFTINEYVFNELYIAHYFICSPIGEGEASLTPTEIDHEMVPEWVGLDDAIEIFSHYPERTPDHESLYLREYTVLNKLKAVL
jgi:ADP-ribose pyrophosphatase YjhB (NUDIX family)